MFVAVVLNIYDHNCVSRTNSWPFVQHWSSHTYTAFRDVIGEGRKAVKKKNVRRAPQLSTGQWEMMGGDNAPFNQKCASSLPALYLLFLGPLTAACTTGPGSEPENLQRHQNSAKCGPPQIRESCHLGLPLLGPLTRRGVKKHRETVEVHSHDVAGRTVLIRSECDSKLPPTKDLEAWGKPSHGGRHND